MFDLDKWSEIWSTVRRHKLRTALTAFGVFWGIFMLVVLLGAGKGFRNGVEKEFSVAKNAIFVWTQRTSVPYMGLKAGRFIQLTNDDVAAIERGVPEAAFILPRCELRGTFTVQVPPKSGSFTVKGEYPGYPAVQALDLQQGRFVNEMDIRSGARWLLSAIGWWRYCFRVPTRWVSMSILKAFTSGWWVCLRAAVGLRKPSRTPRLFLFR
jgi:putative ABC transport system permease protein